MTRKDKIWLFLILFFASIFRLWGFSEWSLTNDELSALHRLNVDNLGALFTNSIWIDGHPAATQVFLYYWTKLFGESAFAIRLPFVLMNSIGIYFFYRSGKLWFNHKAALLATTIISFSQYFILFGALARPYAMGFFAISLFTFFWSKIIWNNKWSLKTIVAFSIVAAVGIMTHYFAALSIVLQLLLGLFFINKKDTKAYLLSIAGIALLCLPHLQITLNHLSLKGLSWLPLADKHFFTDTLLLLFNHSYLWIAVVFVPVLILLYKKNASINWQKQLLFGLLFLLPITIGFAYSYLLSPVLHRSVLFFCLPFLLFFIASFIPKDIKRSNYYSWLNAVVFFGFINMSFFDGYAGSNNYFVNFKKVAETLVQFETEKKHEGILHLSNANHPEYLYYYSEKLLEGFSFDYERFTTNKDIATISQMIDTTKAKYISISHAMTPVFPEVHELIKQKFGKEVYSSIGFHSSVYLYERGVEKRKLLFEAIFDKEIPGKFYFNESSALDSLEINSKRILYISSQNEYPIVFKSNLGLLSSEINRWINVDFEIKSSDSAAVKLIVDIKRNGSSIYWQSFETSGFFRADKWYEVKRIVERPYFAKDDDQLQVFLWNIDGEHFRINDFSIRNFADSKYDYLAPD